MRSLVRSLMGRLFGVLPVLLGAVLFSFVLTRWLPADPAAFLANGPGAGPEAVAVLRVQLGLDQPLATQLWRYAAALLQGDWGHSHLTGAPVLDDLRSRLPATLELGACALALALPTALPLGIAAGWWPGSVWDRLCRALCTLGGCLPVFVVALGLVGLFYLKLGWAPEPTGRLDPLLLPPPVRSGWWLVDTALAGDSTAWRSAAARLLLPSLSLALLALAPLARVSRAALLAVRLSPPVQQARALGLAPRTVLGQALQLAAPAIVTSAGLVASLMLGASVVVEKVFAWPGIGSYALDALLAADHAPLQGFVLLVAALFAALNAAVDALGAWLDPRQATLQDTRQALAR